MKHKIIFLIICIFSILFFQFGTDVRAVNSVKIANSDYNKEQLTVIGNKILIVSKKDFAEKLIQRRIENTFKEIKFTGKFPCELKIEVYANLLAWKLRHRSFVVNCYIEDSEYFTYDIMS